MADFKNIKHFTKNENWGDSDKIGQEVVELLDYLRDGMECPIIIHCGYATDGHASKSKHYEGIAVDFHFDTDISFKDQYLILEHLLKDKPCGLGVYPYWNNKGFHIDTRGVKARWMRDEKGNYVKIDL